MRRRYEDLTGQKFGRLTVVSRGPNSGQHTRWNCICECGNKTLSRTEHLRDGQSHSCGCLNREMVTTHGMSYSREYAIWANMRDRCNNPANVAYQLYGGNGVKVCERWEQSFEAFYADMGPRPTPKHGIDRIDGTKGYSPDNCRWATRQTQMENRRITKRLTIDGVTRTVNEWAAISGIKHATIRGRIERGWDAQRAVFTLTDDYSGKYTPAVAA
jgi:hypothetical protein